MGDVGRTAPVSGSFTGGQREAWDLFIAGYRAGLTKIRDNVSAKTVYDAALAEVRRLAPSLKTPQGKRPPSRVDRLFRRRSVVVDGVSGSSG
jgi:hypothetical protein